MSRVGRLVLGAAVVGMVAACATKPTVVQEGEQRRLEGQAGIRIIEPVKIEESTIVIDARPAFEYSMAHIPRALSLQWSDFTQQEPAQRGVLLKDAFSMARRLARLGISPDSKVVVVGRGLSGGGEEGRLAWTLSYLGVKSARAVPMSYFKGHLTPQAPPAPVSVPIWKPAIEDDVLVTRSELLHVLNKSGTVQPTSFSSEGPTKLYRIIDVRSPREYLGQEARVVPNMEAVNIEWKEFFDAKGRPEPKIVDRLRDVGIEPQHRLVILSEGGLRSAAVTMALKELGFSDVGNYAGGLRDLLSIK